MHKKYWAFAVLILSILIVFVLVFHESWRPGPLLSLQRELNKKAALVYKTGEAAVVTFNISDTDAVIFISPPYAVIKANANISSEVLIKEMERTVGSQETGHLFYIRNNCLLDHRLLTGLAEPVYGIGTGKTINFLITRQETSGRPVRIEVILNNRMRGG